MFITGQRVVCINDSVAQVLRRIYTTFPVKGNVYTVRSIGVGINPKGEPGEIVVCLEELYNPRSKVPPHPERGFNAYRFRPAMPEDEPKNMGQTMDFNVSVVDCANMENTQQ